MLHYCCFERNKNNNNSKIYVLLQRKCLKWFCWRNVLFSTVWSLFAHNTDDAFGLTYSLTISSIRSGLLHHGHHCMAHHDQHWPLVVHCAVLHCILLHFTVNMCFGIWPVAFVVARLPLCTVRQHYTQPK